jgi:hypothetical protein
MREASFVENILPMQESEQIILSKARRWLSGAIRTGFGIFFADTPTSRWFRIFNTRQDDCFMADLLATGHILPYVMGYDTRPLLTMPEKTKFWMPQRQWLLFVPEHDALRDCYRATERNTIEGGFQSGRNLKIVLIVFIVQQNFILDQ